jgi:signal transduction histidine kinase
MLTEIEGSVREALEAVRTISRGLSPDFVNELGLKSALEMLMERAGKRTGLKYELRFAPDFKVKDKSNEVIVFHILRECLTNSLRHAKASKITLTLRDNNGPAEIHFIDDGNGFEEENGKKSSMGLRTMMERAALMNGTLTVNSEKGKGTVILLIFPNH